MNEMYEQKQLNS